MSTDNPPDKPPPKWRELYQETYSILSYTPKRCRYDPANPPSFSLPLNLLFAFAGTFTVANLYYNHPILNILADDFGVTNEQVSIVPTLMQAGYAAGLLFLCPLGDLFKRRTFVLWLVWFTATVWIGLCLTTSFPLFSALSFLTALTTVTPQLMLPLVGDLAPPHRRATALSIVVSGLLLGMLLARVLSGVLTQFTSWRTIYWLSLGLQHLILLLLWLFMPDYPRTNTSLRYGAMLLSIGTLLQREPVLVQACAIGCCTSALFTAFWTTLTFLLAAPPYNYPPLSIGLFALIGIAAFALGPPYSRLIIDRFVPLFSVFLGLLLCLAGVLLGTYLGSFSLAGPVLQAFLLDLGLQTSQIANRSAIYGIAPKARNRVNTAFMVSVFCGQIMGTAVGNRLYAQGGWVRSGSASVGFVGGALVLCVARGPWETGWVGWRGGFGLRRRDLGGKGGGVGDVENVGGEKETGEGREVVGESARAEEETTGEMVEEVGGEKGGGDEVAGVEKDSAGRSTSAN